MRISACLSFCLALLLITHIKAIPAPEQPAPIVKTGTFDPIVKTGKDGKTSTFSVETFVEAPENLTVVAAVPNPVANAAEANNNCPPELVDHYIFDISLDEFIEKKAANDPSDCDWSSNGCTGVPQHLLAIPFYKACWRHDFGYRNYGKRFENLDSENRKKLDEKLRDDLGSLCKGRFFSWIPCKIAQGTYYAGVRLFGEGSENHD